jgi:hypothetical protein
MKPSHPECELCDAVILSQRRRIHSLERELKEWKKLTMAWRQRAGNAKSD